MIGRHLRRGMLERRATTEMKTEQPKRWLKRAVLGIAGLAVLTVSVLAILATTTKLPGEEKTPAGVRQDTALYIKMRDGVHIAVDVWLPLDYQAGQRLPALLRTTRYGRDGQFGWEYRLAVALKQTDPNDEQTDYLNQRHFVVVVADARGSGASGGHRETEFSGEEISDLGELVNWAAIQPWSNGRVGTFGGSYEGATAELTAVTNPPALKAVAPFSSQFDVGVLAFPGGIYDQAVMQPWSDLIRRLDTSGGDVCIANGLSGLRCWWAGRFLRGVKRVDADSDGKQLAQILAQRHNQYPTEELSQAEFRDDPLPLLGGSTTTFSEISAFGHRTQIESSQVAMQVWCGWLDSDVCEGALARYLTFKNRQQVIIGPFSHGLDFNADPFLTPAQHSPPEPTVEQQNRIMADFFDRLLRSDTSTSMESGIHYYTMGEGKWHDTKVWPPQGFDRASRLYFAENHALSPAPPMTATASDIYPVNFAASTGKEDRWTTELDLNILYPDRSGEDGKLLVYTGAPLATDVEISGSPLLVLNVASTATDGAIFAYLEDVGPDGHVTYLDEGELRAINRKQIDTHERPYNSPCAASGSSRHNALPLVPGEPAELKICMWPTSILLRKGHQIRVALAGADAGTFRRYPPVGDVTWTVYRQRGLGSYVELPMRQR
jgi:putative CocE/NonD family hydrolase